MTKEDAEHLAKGLVRALRELAERENLGQAELKIIGVSPYGPVIAYDIEVEPAPSAEGFAGFRSGAEALIAECERAGGVWIDRLTLVCSQGSRPKFSIAVRPSY